MKRRSIRNLTRALALGAVALLPCSAGAVMPDDVRRGTRVEVEGQRLDDKTMTALDLELKAQPGGVDEVSGMVASVDAAQGRLMIHGVPVAIDAATEVKEDGGGPIDFSIFTVGRHAQAEGRYRDGVLHAEQLELKQPQPGEETKVELVGRITDVDRGGSSFKVLGVDVVVTRKTEIQVQ